MSDTVSPSKLYKYRSLSTESSSRTLDILLNNRVWFAVPSSFNDPFDCRLPIPTVHDPATWKSLIPRLFPGTGLDLSDWEPGTEPPEKLRPLIDLLAHLSGVQGQSLTFDQVLNEMAAKVIDRGTRQVDEAVGVLTLSKVPDHMLLWAHYADSHRGICLEFDVASAGFQRLCPVRYANDCPRFDEVVEALALHQFSQERAGLLADVAYQATTHKLPRNAIYYWTGQWLYSKSADWGYEQEWRSVLPRAGLFSFPECALTGVIIGCAPRDDDVTVLRDALQQRRSPIPFYRARRKQGVYGLDIVTVV